MPRPRQRRGADAKKEEKQAKREAAEAEARAVEAAEKRKRYTKSTLDMDVLKTAKSSGSSSRPAADDPNALPECDPDTKAYFVALSSQIDELQQIGHGSYGKQQGEGGEDQDEDDDDLPTDERPLLLRSALESLAGHEVELAGDNETSVILERLLYAMDDFARRVLLDRFTGQIQRLVCHRTASHVLQTLFTIASETVDRETRGIISQGPSTESAANLPTMTALLLSSLNELLPHLPTLLFDPFASHTVRILLRVFAGTPPPTDGATAPDRSKRSAQFRKQQPKMQSFLDPAAAAPTVEITKRKVPDSFAGALESMWESLNGLDEGGPKGEGVRRAAMDDVAGPAVRVMLELEADPKAGGWLAGGWADRVLCGLVEEVNSPESATAQRIDLREEFLAGLLRHPASSPTCETLLALASDAVFIRLWDALFRNKLHRLAGNQVANYVVAVGIKRLPAEALADTLAEVDKVGTERRGEWIDNSRTGVLNALILRAAALGSGEEHVRDILLDTFQVNTIENKKMLLPCVLSLNRLEHFRKLPAAQTSTASTQGSILLQSWLTMSPAAHAPVLDSILQLAYPVLQGYSRDPTSSRVLDALLTSPAVTAASRRRFLMSLIGHYHELADDRIGSRVAERCWATADVYLKDKIAQSLVVQQGFLQQSQFGHFFARKVEIPLWTRRREEWKAKKAKEVQEMLDAQKGRQPRVQAVAEVAEKKRKPVDEIDELFALGAGKAGAGGGKKAKVEEVKGGTAVAPAGMEEVYRALKASAA